MSERLPDGVTFTLELKVSERLPDGVTFSMEFKVSDKPMVPR